MMVAQHRFEVDVAEDVDIVNEKWLVSIFSGAKEMCGLFEAAAGIEEDLFPGDLDVHAEVVVGFKIVGNHVGEVMGVDDDVDNAAGFEAGEREFKKRASGDFNQRLGAVVGERLQARAKTRREDHCLHDATFSGNLISISMCRTMTSRSSRLRRCCANCSARKTERCWPPVQPKETIRFANPRLR